MPVYEYKAVSTSGKSIKGTYTCKNKNDVVRMLHDNSSHPVSIKEVMVKDVEELKLFSSIKTKDIAIFCRQFYTMLNAGVTIINCLEILQLQTENIKLKGVLNDIYEEVQKGSAFSKSLKKHHNVFPELMINMVEAGEVSGKLDVIMNRMAVHFEKENKINNKVKDVMMYPIILGVVSVVVVFFLLIFVMPTFWYLFILGIGIIFILLRRFNNSYEGRVYIDKMKLRIPIIKETMQKIITARFTRTLSILIVSGIPLLRALENTRKVLGNRVVEEALIKVGEEVRKGNDLSGPIKDSGVFPPMVDNMIKIGEEAGTLDDILDKTANFYDEEVEMELHKMTTMLQTIIILSIAVIIGFIVIVMVSPMFNMLNTIK